MYRNIFRSVRENGDRPIFQSYVTEIAYLLLICFEKNKKLITQALRLSDRTKKITERKAAFHIR